MHILSSSSGAHLDTIQTVATVLSMMVRLHLSHV
jgi:hypothetical protein